MSIYAVRRSVANVMAEMIGEANCPLGNQDAGHPVRFTQEGGIIFVKVICTSKKKRTASEGDWQIRIEGIFQDKCHF